jgi:hypothetical protein
MQKSAQTPIPNAGNEESDDSLPARVMVTNEPIHCGVKRKSSELATGMNA